MRKFNDLSKEKPSAFLKFIYTDKLGRGLLKLMISRPVSSIVGGFLSTPLSKPMIKSFIKKNNIDLSIYKNEKYSCYNDFFIRRIKPEFRPINPDKNSLVSPADSKLSVYKIDEKSRFKIKNSYYSFSDLIKDDSLSKEFNNGYLLVFRLCVDDYHRYMYFDDGKILSNKFIKAKLHTVQPIALEKDNFYKENCREITVVQTENFGKAVIIEIGAMMVGKIVNHKSEGSFVKGEEKGYFKFGGSTVAVALKEGSVRLDDEIIENSLKNYETIVLQGEKIGEKEKKNYGES